MKRRLVYQADGPGSFQRPAGITRVRDREGLVWQLEIARFFPDGGGKGIRWKDLVAERGPITDISHVPQ